MINPLEEYYHQLPKADRDCLLFIREYILNFSEHLSEHYKWSAPFFYYKGKMLCYFWIDKKLKKPYISWAEGKNIHHPKIKSGGRARFKLLYLDTGQDIDLPTIEHLLKKSINSLEARIKKMA